jgi:hypothetical protein
MPLPPSRSRSRKRTWVEPVIEAEIAYSTVTENALLRDAVSKVCAGIGISGARRADRACSEPAVTETALLTQVTVGSHGIPGGTGEPPA